MERLKRNLKITKNVWRRKKYICARRQEEEIKATGKKCVHLDFAANACQEKMVWQMCASACRKDVAIWKSGICVFKQFGILEPNLSFLKYILRKLLPAH